MPKKSKVAKGPAKTAGKTLSEDEILSLSSSMQRLRQDCMPDLIGMAATLEVMSKAAQRDLDVVDQIKLRDSLGWIHRALHTKIATIDFCVSQAARAAKAVTHG